MISVYGLISNHTDISNTFYNLSCYTRTEIFPTEFFQEVSWTITSVLPFIVRYSCRSFSEYM